MVLFTGHYAAVATFEPGIEIWDLDVLDCTEPVCRLGGDALVEPWFAQLCFNLFNSIKH